MLSKVSDATVTGVNANSYLFSGTKTPTKDSNYKCTYTFSDFVTGANSINATNIFVKIDTGTYYPPVTTIGILTTEIGTFQNKGTFTFTKDSLTIPANTTLTAYCNMANGQMGNYYSSLYLKELSFDYKGNITISKQYSITGKPRELKNPGNKTETTIFGIHIDGSRVTQDVE